MSYENVTASADIMAAGSKWKYFLDVRTAGERLGELGHIPTSHHLDLGALFQAGANVQSVLPDKPTTETPILAVCRSGNRSGMAAGMLAKAGFTQVGNLVGGMGAWKRLGLPSVYVQPVDNATAVAKLSANEVRDMIVECFADSTLDYYKDNGDKAKAVVQDAFKSEAGTWENPPKEKFDAVLVRLGQICRDHGHPAESIASSTSEFTSLLQVWMK